MPDKQIGMLLTTLTIAIWITANITTSAEAFWPFDQMFASSQTPTCLN